MPLTFWHSLNSQPGQPGAILYEIVAEYNRDHSPQVQVESITPQNYAAAAKEALESPVETRPNFILAPEFMTGAMRQALSNGVVLSAKTLLDESRLADIAEIVSKTFGLDCLPFNPACGVLYMNKTLLAQCGFSPDWKPQSLEDLVMAAKIVKEKSNTAFGYTCAWPEAYLVEIALAQQNIPLLHPNGDYNFSCLTEHLINLRELVKDSVLLLPPPVGNYDKTKDPFIQQLVPFYMQGSGHAVNIEKEAKAAKDIGFEVGYAPLPTLLHDRKVKYAHPLGGAAVWVLNTNTHDETMTPETMAQGVRSFLNYLASKETQAKWHMATAYVPVSKSIRESLGEFYQDHPLHEAVIAQTIDAPLGENSFGIKKANYHLVRPKLYPLIHELLLLQGTPDEVRAIIAKRLEQFDQECNSL